jgi:SEC-C motif-containing protein
MLCLCGSEQDYAQCCGRFIDGQQIPSSPELLMRSRYTAYAMGQLDYIAATMKPPAAEGFDIDEQRRLEKGVQWVGLDVIKTYMQNEKGFVEFRAHFIEGGEEQILHELSEFHQENGQWFYVDAKNPQQPVRKEKVIGRNEPCPCGSQRKYKKCCGK